MSRRVLAVAALCVTAAALAAVAVPGVEWLLTGRVSMDEVHAPARYRTGAAIGIVLTMLVLLGVALYAALRRRALAAQPHGQEKLARLAAIVDSIDDAVIGTDMDGTILSWNAGAARLFGYTSREAAGRHVSMLLPPEPEPELALHHRLVAQGRTVKSHDIVRLAKDGRRVEVSVTRSPIRDEAGTMIGVARIYRDIGEAKGAAAAQQRLSAIVEHSNAAMLTRTLDGTITSWNGAAERLFGYTAAQAIGRHYTLVYPKRDAEHPARTEQLQAGRVVAPFRATRVAKDGSEIDVLVSVSPLTDAAGALEGVAVAFQDLSQLRQAEIALSESEERFEAAFEQAGVGMALRALDPVNPRWLRVNQKLCEILGYTEAELLTMTSLDVTPPEDRAVSLGHGQRLLTDRCERYSREKRYVRKDGTIIWVNLALSIVRRRDGTPLHLISIVEDISARKHAEERLHFQARMLDMVGEAVVGTDAAGTVTYWNRHAARLYGWEADEAVGKNIADVTTAPASREAREQIVRQLAGRNTTSGELELQRRDGTSFTAMVTTAPVIDAAGDIVGYVGISRDITQRKQAEQALLETQRKLELAMASANVGFWYWDIPAGQISYSREWKAQLGYRDDEIGDSFSEWQRLCHPDDLERTYAAAQAALREKRTTYDVEFRMRHKDGSYRWFLSRASIHHDESGEPLRAIGGHIDITERKKTETQLARKTAFYAALADTNEAIAMVDDEAELLWRVCDIAVEKTGLLCASIGFLDPDRGIVTPAAVAGDMKEYANGLEVNLDPDAPTGGGTTARALRENRPCIANDFERSGMSDYWLARARRYGIRSTAAFPLHRGGKVYGGMCVYAGEIDFFDDELVQLLREMALDISLALDARERERKRREAEAKLRESEARYRLIVSNIPNGVVVLYDHDLRYQLVDGAALRAMHIDGASLVGKTLDEVIPPDVASELTPHYRCALAGETATLDVSVLGRDWHVRSLPVQDRSGSIVAGMVIAHDVTETKRAEEQLRLTGLAFDSIADGVMITDAEMRIVSVNKAFTTITGYTDHEVVGKMPPVLHSGKQDERFYDALWQTIKRDGHWQGELWNRRKSGEVYPERLTISAVKNPSGEATHYVGVFNDMSTFKAYEEQLEYLAHHDTLTGLPNRTLLEDRVNAAIGAAQRAGHRIALLFVDLDRFKLINDTLGHAIGDQMLIAVAKRLTACLRATDTVSRHGGDEFLILLPDLQRTDDAARIAEKVLEELSRRYSVGAHQLATSVSIGIAVYPENGTNMADLLRNADAAMYAAKELGRKRYQFYSDSMNARAVERLALETDLRIALEHGQLHLVYQPQFDLRTGIVIGIEALLRWQHPERGEIAPAAFIPVAEETGQIVNLGEWALREACRQNKRWLESGLIDVPVSVNVSSIQFRQVDFAGVVANILRDTGLDARYLGLEVTESVLMGGVEAVSATLRELDAQGLKLAIDDFGIGYSSLSYLRHLPIQQLKIDASFVRDVPDSRDAMAIVEAIISMARSLDVLVVAEGVERSAQAEFLRRSTCHAAQGFLYCRPLRPPEFEAWIASKPSQWHIT